MAETLLPCPFCGGRAERVDIEDGENAGGSCISCTQCQASSNVEFEFKENFVNNWNRRTTRPDLSFLSEEYEFTALQLRSENEAVASAVSSNNRNIILNALDVCAQTTGPKP